MNKNPHSLSPFSQWVLQRLAGTDIQYAVLGDFEEIYSEIAHAKGIAAARRWFWMQILRSFPGFLFDNLYWNIIMLKSYFLIALRNIKRQKGYTFINVTGLAVGIACCLLIAIFIHNELRVDTYHENADRIVRVTYDFKTPDIERALAMVGPPVGPALKTNYPEVEDVTRFASRSMLLRRQDAPDIQYQEDDALFADASALTMFSFAMYRGKPETALLAPFSIVLTRSAAARYFEHEDALGKVLLHEGNAYTVTGLIEDVPENSHFTFDLLASFSTLEQQSPVFAADFWALGIHTYLLLSAPDAAPALTAKLPAYLETQIGESMHLEGHSFRLGIEPLDQIYLHSAYHSSLAKHGNATSLYIFGGIALLILLIACINFVNLTTARAIERAKEVGVRKAIGAHRHQLATQFFGETLLMICTAVVFAILLMTAALPGFVDVSGKSLSMSFILDPINLGVLLCIVLLIALFAGGYPAIVLSQFKPVTVLRGSFRASRRGMFLHKCLVVFQFGLSIGFIISTAIVFSQLNYMQNARLGYEKNEMLNISFHGDAEVQQQANAIKQTFLQRADVSSISISGDIPARGNLHSVVGIEAANKEMRNVPWRFMSLDFDFIDNYQIEMIAGRSFSRDFATDSTEAMVINKAAAVDLGYLSPEDAIGASFTYGDRTGKVIGISSDFHLKSLQQVVEPVYMLIEPTRYQYFSLRLDTKNLITSISQLEDTWQTLVPHRPFEYSFLSESLERLYREEEQFGSIVGTFALLAIFIACMGLFGLAALSTRQRTREIGLRKILGASASSIALLITGEFARLVLLAFVIISPLVYFAADRWLDGFAHRIDISWPVFLIAGTMALFISWLTISYHALSAATKNPIVTLRRE